MNPIERLNNLESRIRKLESPDNSRPRRGGRGGLPRLDDKAKSIVVEAFAMLGDGPHQRKDWLDAISMLDEKGIVPDLRAHSETLRALLAEQLGLYVKWSTTAIKKS